MDYYTVETYVRLLLLSALSTFMVVSAHYKSLLLLLLLLLLYNHENHLNTLIQLFSNAWIRRRIR